MIRLQGLPKTQGAPVSALTLPGPLDLMGHLTSGVRSLDLLQTSPPQTSSCLVGQWARVTHPNEDYIVSIFGLQEGPDEILYPSP